MSVTSLEKWKVFQSLDQKVKQDIRLAIVIGSDSAIYVTKGDEAFGIGMNPNGCLGTGDMEKHPEPKRIETLGGQNIQGLEFATNAHYITVFAISASGLVFAWGRNDCGQLGLGTIQDTLLPTKISGSLEGQRVVQVACGDKHTLALTSDGKIFVFGSNEKGALGLAGDIEEIWAPTILEGPLAGKVVNAIACGCYVSAAILNTGELYAWGHNGFGLVPRAKNGNIEIPLKVAEFGGVEISKIAFGVDYALALSKDGKIYAWGDNKHGQLGTGTTDSETVPKLLSNMAGRIQDIAATHCYLHPNAAITEANEVYFWGRCGRGQNILNPLMIPGYSSLDEVYAIVPPKQATFRALRLKESLPKMNDSLVECLKKMFDDHQTSDFVFVVEGKKVHVHKVILIMRCAVLRTMFLGDWKESNEKEIIIEGHSYDAFHAFLKYFYTDEIDLQPALALDVFALAHFYHLVDLQNQCEALIKNGLTVENVSCVYDKAILYAAKELEDFAFNFCMDHLSAVVSSENFDILDPKVSRDFFRRAATHGAFKK
ncbi:Hypothetical predicted protein [Cloeon dipterum]|uniref:BTB domain-containing protein n=1 Tax=Cloeon dipterum TaxID=197152 RepID=A0A8S1DKK7_9INSE|nr:Hypothetical predicted protein [Cloeon dipterum]